MATTLGTVRNNNGVIEAQQQGDRLRRLLPSNSVYVGDYGAVGDGSTDDRAAILLAIEDALDKNAAVVFDAKPYAISKEIRLTAAAGHVYLLGTPTVNGVATTIKSVATMRATISIIGAHTIRNIGFDANLLAEHGMYFQGCSNSLFESVGVVNALKDGVYLSGETDGASAWAASTTYNTVEVRVLNAGSYYELISPGTSAASGGPTGTGQAITDNTAIWRYIGPSIAWQANNTYAVGDLVINSGNVYECLRGGQSAASGGPSTTSQLITDNGRVWRYIITSYTYAINDFNHWNNCSFQANGRAWVTSGLDGSVTGLYWSTAQRTIVTGTASTSGTTITITGGPDVRTLGLRRGDYVRVDSNTNKKFRMLSSVPTTANQLIVDTAFAQPHSSVDFVIMRGDGYREEEHGDNNINSFAQGLVRTNVGAGFAFNGLYGPTVSAMQIDHNGYAIRAALVGGNPVISALVAHCYTEANQSGKPFKLAAAQNWVILCPISDNNNTSATANIDYGSGGDGACVGLYVSRDGMDPIGSYSLYRNNIATTYVQGASTDFGFAYIQRELSQGGAPNYEYSTSAVWYPAGNSVVLNPGGADATLGATPSIGLTPGRLLYLACKENQSFKIVLQDETVLSGSKLKLSTGTIALAAGESVLLYCNGSYWYELGRFAPKRTLYFNSARTQFISSETTNVGLDARGDVSNGGSAVAHVLDNATALTTAGARLASIRNAGIEKSYINKDGAYIFHPSSAIGLGNYAYNVFGGFVYNSSTSFLGMSNQGGTGHLGLYLSNGHAEATHQFTAAALISTAGIDFATRVRCTDKGDSSSSPGNATVNKGAGKSAIASSSSSVTITCDKVASDSVVNVIWEVDPGSHWWVTVASGSFTVNVASAPGSSKTFRWFVVN